MTETETTMPDDSSQVTDEQIQAKVEQYRTMLEHMNTPQEGLDLEAAARRNLERQARPQPPAPAAASDEQVQAKAEELRPGWETLAAARGVPADEENLHAFARETLESREEQHIIAKVNKVLVVPVSFTFHLDKEAVEALLGDLEVFDSMLTVAAEVFEELGILLEVIETAIKVESAVITAISNSNGDGRVKLSGAFITPYIIIPTSDAGYVPPGGGTAPPPPPPAAAPVIVVPADHAGAVDPNVMFQGTAGADTSEVQAWDAAGGPMIASGRVHDGHWQFTVNQGPWAPGQHSVIVTGLGDGGYGPQGHVTFTVPHAPPARSPHVITPTDGMMGVSQLAYFSGTADDDTAKVRVWNTDTDRPAAPDQAVSDNGTWTLSAYFELGLHHVSVYGLNYAGQSSPFQFSFTVGYDSQAGTPTIDTPRDGDPQVNSNVYLSGTVDNATSVRIYNHDTGDQLGGDQPVTNRQWHYTTHMPPGLHHVAIAGVKNYLQGDYAHVSFTVEGARADS